MVDFCTAAESMILLRYILLYLEKNVASKGKVKSVIQKSIDKKGFIFSLRLLKP